MTCILDFTNPHFLESQLPAKRHGLKLILWAGDGAHDGMSDVQRLPAYDVFVCLGLPSANLQKNIADLSATQILCIIDVNKTNQMEAFSYIFQGAFDVIDADYYGNTPSLPLALYAPLLSTSGKAFHTEGINSLVMPTENMLNTVELFAPVLPYYIKEQRLWSSGILELAKRDDIPASQVWSSPDFKHPFYDWTREQQNKFLFWQKQRNPAWPSCAETLESQWDSLPTNVLCVRINSRGVEEMLVGAIEPHLQSFCNYLSQKVDSLASTNERFSLRRVDGVSDYSVECAKAKDVYDSILIRQKMLNWLSVKLPPQLVCVVGYYRDERHADAPITFGMYYVKDSD